MASTVSVYDDIHLRLLSDTVSDGETRKGWKCRQIERLSRGLRATNRYYKIMGPVNEFCDYDYSVYTDNNILVLRSVETLLRSFKKSQAAIGLFRHAERSNLHAEVEACRRLGKFDDVDRERIDEQLRTYAATPGVHEQPLTDNAVLIRWHRHPALEPAMQLWWDQLCQYSIRDQISLPFVLAKTKIPYKLYDFSPHKSNPYFVAYPNPTNHRNRVKRALLLSRDAILGLQSRHLASDESR